MPGPDITRPKSKRAASFFLFLKCAILAAAAVTLLAQPFSGCAARNPSYPQSQPVQSPSAQPPSTQSPSTQPSAPAQPPAASSPQRSPNDTGTFVIHKNVDEVLIH